MKSLFAKILLWFCFTLAVTVVGSAFISALNVNENASDERAPVARLVTFQLEEARSAYEIGGRPGLQAFLDTLHRVYDARGILTDETGRDLLTNEDRSDLVRRARRPYFFQIFRTGDAMVARADDDRRYWFFYIVPRVRVGSWFLLPEQAFVMGAGVLLCYWLALYLPAPCANWRRRWNGSGAATFRRGWDRTAATNWANWRARSIAWRNGRRPC